MSVTFSVNADAYFMGLTPHFAQYPPAPPVIQPHGEMHVMSKGWLLGAVAAGVWVDGAPAVQLGHDVGAFIPHVSAPNPLLAAHYLFSGCKVNFSKTTVLAGGKPAGMWVPLVGMFQLCADPVPIPTGVDVSALWTTVKYGSSWGDIAVGQVRCAVDATINLAAAAIVGPMANKLATRHAMRMLAKTAPKKAVAKAEEGVVKLIEKPLVWLMDKLPGKDPRVNEKMETLDDVSRYIDQNLDAPNPDEIIEEAYDELLEAIPVLRGGDEEAGEPSTT